VLDPHTARLEYKAVTQALVGIELGVGGKWETIIGNVYEHQQSNGLLAHVCLIFSSIFVLVRPKKTQYWSCIPSSLL